jgi:hypothetical protein
VQQLVRRFSAQIVPSFSKEEGLGEYAGEITRFLPRLKLVSSTVPLTPRKQSLEWPSPSVANGGKEVSVFLRQLDVVPMFYFRDVDFGKGRIKAKVMAAGTKDIGLRG